MESKGRVWTAERRLRYGGMESSGRCALCDQLPESIDRLTASCVVSREVWVQAPSAFRLACAAPVAELNARLADWCGGCWLGRIFFGLF
jgi:hypothetical protein